jgi:eukaryotic-like serine/threonine-protein kinase
MRVLSPGATLCGRYQILGLAGQGGMGAVYAARDTRLGLTVALKQTLATDEGLRRAFRREGRLLAALRHPCLPRVLDHFEDAGDLFLAMEYIPGDDLAAQLAGRGRPFPVAEVLGWADALLEALEYLHGQSPPVVHRDIKPQNLKLTPAGNIVLLDFGLARGAAGGQTRMLSGATVSGYTLSYAPVEQIQGGSFDERADLYALGATLYHLLAGVPPIDALARAVARLDGDPDPLLNLRVGQPDLPAAVSDVIMAALAIRAVDRPQRAADLRAALRAATLRAEPPTPVVQQRPQWAWWVMWVMPLVALALAIVISVGAIGAATPIAEPTIRATTVTTAAARARALVTETPTLAANPIFQPIPTLEPFLFLESTATTQPSPTPITSDTP